MIKLDYTLTSPEERNELVKKILEENPNPNEKYLEILTDYLIFAMEKEEKKERKILRSCLCQKLLIWKSENRD